MSSDNTEMVNFNQLSRDRWVQDIANCLSQGTRVLDVGAGECRYRDLFPRCDYRTHDFHKYEGTNGGLLKDRWRYGQIDYLSDITSIPVPNNSFDVVLCTEVLEHVPEPIAAIKELHRILKIDGLLFLSAPLGSGLHQQPYHFYGGFTPHFYNHFLRNLGFDILSIKPNGHFFLLLLQEINRGIHILRSNHRYPRWRPVSWLLKAGSSRLFAKWMAGLDDKIPIDEFTVGYHVQALKVREIAETQPT
jgi:SAM-dependent methyltransferase